VWCRQAFGDAPDSLLGRLWVPAIGIGYVFLANLAASALKLVLLIPQFRGFAAGFDRALFRRLIRYSLPMVIIGFAGIVNDMLDRPALKYLLPYDAETNMAQLGIYSACYKLSILMTLFIQAFRYAGEPFFFAYARQSDARQTYATVLNYFVIFCVFIFLLVTLYLGLFKYFVGAPYREGLHIVPILLLANLLLGVYVNLSIWYKLTDRTLMGAWVTLTGSGITVALLFWLVPIYGYEGAAWARLICYGAMVVLSYLLGRKYYPVPYDLKRAVGYVALGIGLYGLSRLLVDGFELNAPLVGTSLLIGFLALFFLLDGRILIRRPAV
jgi:O-antigen/teichoic acid export membrane protein